MVKGAAWVIGLRAASRVLGLVSLMTLARILAPEDYGLIALAGVFAGAIQLFSAFNFDVWLIRHPNPAHDHYNTVWTLSIIRGAVTCLALILLAEPISALFSESRLQNILLVLAIGHALRGFQNVGVIDFQKDLEFDRDSILLGSSKIASFVVAVIVAVIFRSYWALVAGIITEHVFKLILSYSMHRYRPSLSMRRWGEAFAFSKWLLLSNVLNFAYRRADTFILGKLIGSHVLGLYSVARELANLASTELLMPIRRVMLPAYAKLINDPIALRQSFLDGLGLMLLVGIPCTVGIGLTSDPLVRVILGEKWLEAVPLVKILALYGLATMGLANQGPLLVALGRTKLYSLLTVLGVAIMLPCFAWGTWRYGVVGGAWGAVVASVCLFGFSLVVTLRAIEVRIAQVIQQTWRTVVATMVMTASILIAQMQIDVCGYWSIVELAVYLLIGVLSFTATMILLWRLGCWGPGPERLVVDFARRWLQRSDETL